MPSYLGLHINMNYSWRWALDHVVKVEFDKFLHNALAIFSHIVFLKDFFLIPTKYVMFFHTNSLIL